MTKYRVKEISKNCNVFYIVEEKTLFGWYCPWKIGNSYFNYCETLEGAKNYIEEQLKEERERKQCKNYEKVVYES